MKNRRQFLKKSALALGGVALVSGASFALAKDKENNLVKGKSKKKEVLYQRSAQWQKYYIKAE